jgi:hypothetical protein
MRGPGVDDHANFQVETMWMGKDLRFLRAACVDVGARGRVRTPVHVGLQNPGRVVRSPTLSLVCGPTGDQGNRHGVIDEAGESGITQTPRPLHFYIGEGGSSHALSLTSGSFSSFKESLGVAIRT